MRPAPRLRLLLLCAFVTALFLFQCGLAPAASELDVLYVRRLLGELRLPPEPYFEALSHGPYFLFSRVLAGALGALGLARHWAASIALIRAAVVAWAVWPLHALFKRLTQDEDAALLGVLFFAMNVTFISVATGDVVNARLSHLAAVPAVLWSLERYLGGRKNESALWAALGIFLHLSPTVYLFPLYLIEDLREFIVRPSRRAAAVLAARWTALAAFCGFFLGSVGAGSAPAPPDAYLASVRYFSPQISLITAADKANLCFSLEGLLWLAALGGYSGLSHAGVLRRFSLLIALGCVASTAAAAVSPPAPLLPLWRLAVKIVWLRSLWFIDVFALAAAAARLASLARGERASFAAAAILCACLFVQRDYVVRAAGLPAALAGRVKERALWSGLAAAASALLVWLLQRKLLMSLALRWLPLHGGIFDLPSFSPAFLLLLAAAAAAAAAGARLKGARSRLGLLALLAAASLASLRLAGGFARPWQSPEWKALAGWIRKETPPESLWIAPLETDLFEMMSEARRNVYAANEFYDVIFAASGFSGPIVRRFQDYGVDFSRNGSAREVAEELSRAERDLSVTRMRELVKDAPAAYVLRPSSRPLPGLREAYRNPAYVVYRLR